MVKVKVMVKVKAKVKFNFKFKVMVGVIGTQIRFPENLIQDLTSRGFTISYSPEGEGQSHGQGHVQGQGQVLG